MYLSTRRTTSSGAMASTGRLHAGVAIGALLGIV
jgi:hypothetical protein